MGLRPFLAPEHAERLRSAIGRRSYDIVNAHAHPLSLADLFSIDAAFHPTIMTTYDTAPLIPPRKIPHNNPNTPLR